MISVRQTSARTLGSSPLFSTSLPRRKERLVILGSGWGGYTLLRGVDKRRWDVTILSPTSYFNFTPLLAGCAVGTLDFHCAVEPVRRYAPQVTSYQAWCDGIGKSFSYLDVLEEIPKTQIDFKNKTLKCMPATSPVGRASQSTPREDSRLDETPAERAPFTLKYDKLVIAVGAYSQTFSIPGVKENALFLKDVKDARTIHTRILECFEQANQPIISDDERRKLLNFCIVGGGPTGVEFAAELHDLLHSDIAQHFPALAKMAKINLYDVSPQILGSFDKNLVQYTEKTFRRDGISIWTSHHVTKVEPGKLFVEEQGVVPFGLLVWSTGLAPNPLISSITEMKKHDRSIGLLTNDRLNIINKDGSVDEDVWVIGDCGIIEGEPLPATAQVAAQKGKYLFKTLNAVSRDQAVSKPFEFKNLGSLAYIGDWKAIYDRPGSDGFLSKESGRLAWLLWRSAYFTMTLSTKNKILVPFYWFLTWIFGRDLTRF